jgi:hypothetical protein
MAESWVINSDNSLNAFIKNVNDLYKEHKYITYGSPRIGKDRSLGQNALFHVWLTDFGCHLAKCHFTQFSDGMMEGTKKSIKGLFYREYPREFMIHEVECVITKRKKKDYTSSAKWKQGEMFEVLTWFQNFAASQGCVLESKGEFNKLQREQNQ